MTHNNRFPNHLPLVTMLEMMVNSILFCYFTGELCLLLVMSCLRELNPTPTQQLWVLGHNLHHLVCQEIHQFRTWQMDKGGSREGQRGADPPSKSSMILNPSPPPKVFGWIHPWWREWPGLIYRNEACQSSVTQCGFPLWYSEVFTVKHVSHIIYIQSQTWSIAITEDRESQTNQLASFWLYWPCVHPPG